MMGLALTKTQVHLKFLKFVLKWDPGQNVGPIRSPFCERLLPLVQGDVLSPKCYIKMFLSFNVPRVDSKLEHLIMNYLGEI